MIIKNRKGKIRESLNHYGSHEAVSGVSYGKINGYKKTATYCVVKRGDRLIIHECGAKVSEKASFCYNCGHPITKMSPLLEMIQEHPAPKEQEANLAQVPGNIIDELGMVVGEKKKDYYLQQWSKETVGQTWNWSAFFGGLIWLSYRKMYVPFAAFFALLVIIELILAFNRMNLFIAYLIIGFIMHSFMGFMGNRLYHFHVRRTIKKIKKIEASSSAITKAMKEIGGTSWGGIGISTLAFLLNGIIITLVVSLFSYLDRQTTKMEHQLTMEVLADSESHQKALAERKEKRDKEKILQDVIDVIRKNTESYQSEDLEGYMSTIYNDGFSKNSDYHKKMVRTEKTFKTFDFVYQVNDIEFVYIHPNVVQVKLNESRFKLNGPEFENQVITRLHTLKKQEGKWKIARSKIVDMFYIDKPAEF